jgi:hypothetical protein
VSTEVHTTSERSVDIVVPPTETLTMDEVREIVGAKNVMGTCSG